MILTIITVLVIIIGVNLLCKDDGGVGVLFGLGLLSFIGGGLIAVIMTACIICAHV